MAAHLSGPPTAVRDDDEDAKRFDALMLGTQLVLLRSEAALARLQTKVQQLGSSPLELANAQRARTPASDRGRGGRRVVAGRNLCPCWSRRGASCAAPSSSSKRGRTVVYTDFEDAIGETSEVDLPWSPVRVDFERFRAKAKVFLRAHEDRLALHKLVAQPTPDRCRLGKSWRPCCTKRAARTAICIARALHTSLPMFVRSWSDWTAKRPWRHLPT